MAESGYNLLRGNLGLRLPPFRAGSIARNNSAIVLLNPIMHSRKAIICRVPKASSRVNLAHFIFSIIQTFNALAKL